MNFNIVYEDEVLIIVNKPEGMPTQSSENGNKLDLYTDLQNFLNERENKNVYLGLHHRLDAATSGLVLFSKSKHYNKHIANLFQNQKILKKYIALSKVKTEVQIESSWIVENKLLSYKYKHYKKSKISNNGKIAITHFNLISIEDQIARIECIPKTGRLHQIRVHLASMNLPIIGDFHYNNDKDFKSLMLCAYYMEFNHPKTRKKLQLSITPPF